MLRTAALSFPMKYTSDMTLQVGSSVPYTTVRVDASSPHQELHTRRDYLVLRASPLERLTLGGGRALPSNSPAVVR